MTPSPDEPLRIAMWSGPRNVSTAMLRSFGSRDDCAVCDEPLYAHYLALTGLAHPMAAEVMASQPTDWRELAEQLTGPVPGAMPVWYQKHMAHHLLPDIGREWLSRLTHGFLIRRPDEMIASLAKVTPEPTLEDTGLPQQVALFDELVAAGQRPPVVDGADILADPPALLSRLCERLGLAWTDAMLAWEPGLRDTDGVWAPAWYDAVAASTGFAPPRPRNVSLEGDLAALLERCQPLYEHLHAHRLTT
jgi:hypothetical protein